MATVPIVLGLPAAIVASSFWGYSHDDTFITYRYADQWARGNGLTFNTGEHILGTSAPGYALLLGLLSRLTGSRGIGVAEWGTILGLAAILAVSGFLAAGLESQPVSVRFGVPLLFGLEAFLWQWNVEMLGSETLLIVSLVAAGTYLVFRREAFFAGGIAFAAAMILRPDAGLAAGAVGMVFWISRGRFPWRFTLTGLAPLAVWLGGLYSRFGTVLPTTLAGKRSEYTQANAAYLLAEWNWLRRTLPLASCIALLALASVAIAVYVQRGYARHPAVVAILLWLLFNEIAYRAVRVPFAPWYHEGLVNGVLVLAAVGAVAVGDGMLFWRRRGHAAPAPLLLAGALLLPVLLPSLSYVQKQWRRPPDPRFENYRAVGQFLQRHARPDATAVAVEVGIIGYFSRLRILDLSGLVTPSVIRLRTEGRLAQFVVAAKPDFIVDVPSFRGTAQAFLKEPGVLDSYRVAGEFSRGGPSEAAVILLERSEVQRIPSRVSGSPPEDMRIKTSGGIASGRTGRSLRMVAGASAIRPFR